MTQSSSAAPAAFPLSGHVVGLGLSRCPVPAPPLGPYESVHRRSSGICLGGRVFMGTVVPSGAHLQTFLKRNCGLKDFHLRAQGETPGGGISHPLPGRATPCRRWPPAWPGPPTTDKTPNLLHCQTWDFPTLPSGCSSQITLNYSSLVPSNMDNCLFPSPCINSLHS